MKTVKDIGNENNYELICEDAYKQAWLELSKLLSESTPSLPKNTIESEPSFRFRLSEIFSRVNRKLNSDDDYNSIQQKKWIPVDYDRYPETYPELFQKVWVSFSWGEVKYEEYDGTRNIRAWMPCICPAPYKEGESE